LATVSDASVLSDAVRNTIGSKSTGSKGVAFIASNAAISSSGIVSDVENDDLDRVAQLEHGLKTCVMELIALMDIFDGNQSDVLYELEYASESLRIASQNIAKQQAALRQKITTDKHLRLVYSKGGK